MSRFRVVNSKGRPSLLYRVYRDARGRTRGHSTKCPWVYAGLPFGFDNFADFRAFALAHGFSKATPSPDRIIPEAGYVPSNVRFVAKKTNYAGSQGRMSDDDFYGRSEHEP